MTGKHHNVAAVDGVSADLLNSHFASISTDIGYTSPPCKISASANQRDTEYISEYSVFQYLDKLNHTATGLDGFPAWFLSSESERQSSASQ